MDLNAQGGGVHVGAQGGPSGKGVQLLGGGEVIGGGAGFRQLGCCKGGRCLSGNLAPCCIAKIYFQNCIRVWNQKTELVPAGADPRGLSRGSACI